MTPRYEIRPLGTWTDPITDPRATAPFRAHWDDTRTLLERETARLGAKLIVVQVDVTEGNLRRDGMLRAQAKVTFPGVRVYFDSKHGPLTYATDRFTDWRSNVRAIALALEALRKIDRYGVGGKGEQYAGWAALPTADARMTPDEAATLLAAAFDGVTPEQIRTDAGLRARAYRQAALRTHPDHGGDAGAFKRVTAARDLLEKL